MNQSAERLIAEAEAAKRAGRLSDAREYLLQAAVLLTGDEDSLQRGGVLRELAELKRKAGDLDGSRELYETAVVIYESAGDPQKLAHAVRHLGDVYCELGRDDLAGPCFAKAVELYRGDADTRPGDLANAIRSMAVLQERSGNVAEARMLWQEARNLYGALDIAAGVAESSNRLKRLAG